jgi:hypothetical protein
VSAAAQLIVGQPFAAYQAAEGLNWSRLKHAVRSPLHYRAALAGELRDSSVGPEYSAMHAAILEPQTFATAYGTWPGRRAGADFEAAQAADPRRVWLSQGEADLVAAVRDAVHAHPVGGPLVRGVGAARALPELSMYWTESGRRMKGRGDLVLVFPDEVVLIDLKAVPSIRPRQIAAEVTRRLYHAQLAHYAAGLGACLGALGLRRPIRGLILAYETRPCPDVAVYDLGTADSDGPLWVGAEVRGEALAAVEAAEVSGVWQGQAPDLQPLNLPSWAYDEADDESAGDV